GKGEVIKGGERSDRDGPVRSALYDCSGDCIMRPRLIDVACWPHAAKELIYEQPRARSGVTIDHQAILIGKCNSNCICRRTSSKSRIIWPVNETLHADPALLQRQPGPLEMHVVEPAPWVEEVNRREVAFASFNGGDSA